MKLIKDRITSLDAIGFDWRLYSYFPKSLISYEVLPQQIAGINKY